MTEGKLSEGRSSGRETIVSRRLCLIGGQLEKGIIRDGFSVRGIFRKGILREGNYNII